MQSQAVGCLDIFGELVETFLLTGAASTLLNAELLLEAIKKIIHFACVGLKAI